MSREAWGDPPEQEPERCPVCDGTEHTEDCELGEEMSKRRRCERELAEWREMALSQSGDAGLLARAMKAETEAAFLRSEADLSRAALEAAEDQAAKNADEVLKLREELEQMRLAEQGAEEAFGAVVQSKRDAEAECRKLRGLLDHAYSQIRRQAQMLADSKTPNAKLNGQP